MNLVIPVRKGGLGNQMFQVAAALVYGKETQRTVVIPLETPHIHRVHSNPYELSIFKGLDTLQTVLDSLSLYALCQNGFTLYPGEPGFEQWEPLTTEGNIVLHGYFQYYPPFERHKEFLSQFFLHNLEPYREKGTSHIGIHIRRGDYLKFPDVFSLLGPSYYCRAIQEMGKRVPTQHYKIFSDDIAWCKEQDMFQNLESVEFIQEPDEIKCLSKMIACEGGFICANSSYSWWAAFLGAFQKGSVCIVPETWCKGFTGDLIPKEWIVIPNAKGSLVLFEPGTLNLHEKKDVDHLIKPLHKTVEVYVDCLKYSHSSNPKVFVQLEPVAIQRDTEQHLVKNYNMYDTIYTFNETVLQGCPNAKKTILPACSWISRSHWGSIDTTKKAFQVSCITGSKQLAEGHTYRLLLYANQKILKDVYSMPITFYRSSADQPLPELTNNPFIQKDKFPLFETFQYSFVIENSSQTNYFTEKLIDCLITKTIPIYYGCPNIAEYFDTTGWILLTEKEPFERLQEFVEKWKQANYSEDSYERFKESIEANYRLCKERYSGFYTTFHRLFLENPAFE
jgi:hypothetical protein